MVSGDFLHDEKANAKAPIINAMLKERFK
jgi:hypothetical protein